MSQHLPELWHKDIGYFSDAIRSRDLPPSILEARAHESVEAFHTALAANRLHSAPGRTQVSSQKRIAQRTPPKAAAGVAHGNPHRTKLTPTGGRAQDPATRFG
jgi:hypothetical protein